MQNLLQKNLKGKNSVMSENASLSLHYDGEREEIIALYGRHARSIGMVEARHAIVQSIIVQGAKKVIVVVHSDCALMASGTVLILSIPVAVVVAAAGGYALPSLAR